MNNSDHLDMKGDYSWTDCVDFWFDGPWDNTIRPIPPERIERVKALRDQILAAEAAEKAATKDKS